MQIIRTDAPEDNTHIVINIITDIFMAKLPLFFSIFLYLN